LVGFTQQARLNIASKQSIARDVNIPRSLALLLSVLTSACGAKRNSSTTSRDAVATLGDAVSDALTDVRTDVRRDAARNFVPPTKVMATAIWTPVHVEPERHSKNMGYLRGGAIVDVVEGPVRRQTCVVHRGHPEGGWYRIRDGGFVCVGGAMASRWPNHDFARPRQPVYDSGMPYPYAINYGMTVLYRRPPTSRDLHLYEPWRYDSRPDEEFTNDQLNRPPGVPIVRAHPRTLNELRGTDGGPMIRRLMVGMYVALDRLVRNDEVGERYWHTQAGGYVRESRLSTVHVWSTGRGTELNDTVTLPYAFAIANDAFNYTISPGGSLGAHRRIPKLTGVALADAPPIIVGGRYPYYRTADGLAVSARAVRRITPQNPPPGTGPNEKWIDVDLDEQILAAYEGTRPVYVALIASGRAGDDAEHDFQTPTGTFRILSKHVTNSMDGETPNGVYSIEDVPWVMYFNQSYALHGAFWHQHFGWRMSHGCVNLQPGDAQWLAYWSDPPLPQNWHGVYATPQRLGSQVVIRHSRNNQYNEAERPREAAAADNSGN
jgi:hypothetical protein